MKTKLFWIAIAVIAAGLALTVLRDKPAITAPDRNVISNDVPFQSAAGKSTGQSNAVTANKAAAQGSGADTNEVRRKLAALTGVARDRYLREISTNNPLFQAWGKEKILNEANRLLARVQPYGLSGPLTASNTIGTTQLFSGPTGDKYQLWLHTTDRKHRFRYEDGRLYEIYSVEGDYLRNGGKQPGEALSEWGQADGKWTEAEARAAFDQLLKTLEVPLNPNAEGTRVEVEPFEINVGNNTVTPFYTVRLFGDGNILRADIHFRSTSNGWQPTLINFRIRGATGNDPTAEELIARFY